MGKAFLPRPSFQLILLTAVNGDDASVFGIGWGSCIVFMLLCMKSGGTDFMHSSINTIQLPQPIPKTLASSPALNSFS